MDVSFVSKYSQMDRRSSMISVHTEHALWTVIHAGRRKSMTEKEQQGEKKMTDHIKSENPLALKST